MQSDNQKLLLSMLSPANLAVTFSNGKWSRAKHLDVIDYEFRSHLKSDRDILIIKAPVRHGKSEFLSRWAPAWFILRNPYSNVIVSTHTASLAKDHSRWVRDRVHELAPLVGLKGVDASHSAAQNWRMEGVGGGMLSAGIGTAIVGYGADLFLIDDYVKGAQEALSETVRDRTWDWFTSNALTRLSPTGKLVILSTQWHEDDLIGRIMSRKEDLGVKVRCVTLQAICEDKKICPLRREVGEALWPERWPIEMLERRRKTLPPRWWTSLFQGKPGSGEASTWPDHYFQNIWTDNWPSQFGLSVCSLDPSKGKNARKGDYFAGVFVGYHEGRLWVDSIIDRQPVPSMMLSFARFCHERQPLQVAIEGNAFQELLARDWVDSCDGLGYYAPSPIMLQNSMNKLIRIERLGTLLAKRELVFRRTSSNELLVSQMKEFPFGAHDDGPDALEASVRTMYQMAGSEESESWEDVW